MEQGVAPERAEEERAEEERAEEERAEEEEQPPHRAPVSRAERGAISSISATATGHAWTASTSPAATKGASAIPGVWSASTSSHRPHQNARARREERRACVRTVEATPTFATA